jgi:hypothetical protein
VSKTNHELEEERIIKVFADRYENEPWDETDELYLALYEGGVETAKERNDSKAVSHMQNIVNELKSAKLRKMRRS